jgi:hypothetical protein
MTREDLVRVCAMDGLPSMAVRARERKQEIPISKFN